MKPQCVVWRVAARVSPGVSLSSLEDRLFLQKVGYIVQEILGRDLGYKFSWYSYGPYSRGLARDLHSRDCREQEEDPQDLEDLSLRLAKIYSRALSACPQERSSRILEIVASIHMISRNTYPRSEDPVADLLRLKPYLDRACVQEVHRVMKIEGIL